MDRDDVAGHGCLILGRPVDDELALPEGQPSLVDQLDGLVAIACVLPALLGLPLARFLQPNDFAVLDAVEHGLLAFGERYEQLATPFEWKFTRADLHRLMVRLDRSPLVDAAV